MIFILLRKRNNSHNTRKSLFLYAFVDRQIRLISFTANIYSQSWVLHSSEKKWDCNSVLARERDFFLLEKSRVVARDAQGSTYRRYSGRGMRPTTQRLVTSGAIPSLSLAAFKTCAETTLIEL